MIEPCIRCGVRPACPTCDWLHCEPCWHIMCDEVHQALADLDADPPDNDEFYAADLLAAGDATDDEIEF